MRICGEAVTPFTLEGGELLSWRCMVSSQFSFGLLLGTDFLRANKATLSFEHQTVTFPGCRPVAMLSAKFRGAMMVAGIHTYIGPGERVIVWGRLNGSKPSWWKEKMTVELQPSRTLAQEKGVAVARSWDVLDEDDEMRIYLVNPLGRLVKPDVKSYGL